AEALGTAPGSLAYNAGQIFGGSGYSEHDSLSKYFRDAAAWRFLGPANTQVYAQHGDQLLRHWQSDGRRLASVEHEAELFDQVTQRQALQAELDEVRVLRSRLRSVINEWQAARKQHGADGDAALDPGAVAELAELAARCNAALLAGKSLLLRTHARLEYG